MLLRGGPCWCEGAMGLRRDHSSKATSNADHFKTAPHNLQTCMQDMVHAITANTQSVHAPSKPAAAVSVCAHCARARSQCRQWLTPPAGKGWPQLPSLPTHGASSAAFCKAERQLVKDVLCHLCRETEHEHMHSQCLAASSLCVAQHNRLPYTQAKHRIMVPRSTLPQHCRGFQG